MTEPRPLTCPDCGSTNVSPPDNDRFADCHDCGAAYDPHEEGPAMSDQAVGNDGPEKWVPEAIAQQEEYLKRIRSCQGQLGLSHSWDKFSPRPGVVIEQCWRCKVTRTDDDYQRKTEAEQA